MIGQHSNSSTMPVAIQSEGDITHNGDFRLRNLVWKPSFNCTDDCWLEGFSSSSQL